MYINTAKGGHFSEEFSWKLICEMKYLYTRNHLNYLKFTDVMVFQMKSYMFINHYGLHYA